RGGRGAAEIAPEEPAEIGHVLDGPGPIQLPALAQLAHDLVGREVAGEDARGIAGDEPDDGEDEPGDHEERRHSGDQAGEDAAPGHVARGSVFEEGAMQGVERLEWIPVEALEALARRPDLGLAVEEEDGSVLHEDLLHPMERLQPLLRVERALLESEEPVELVALVERDVVAGRAPELRAEVLDGAVDVAVDGAPAEERRLDLAL